MSKLKDLVFVRKLKHGHHVYASGSHVVLMDDSGESCVIDKTRPIQISYCDGLGSCASIPVSVDQWTPEPISGALWLARYVGLEIHTDEGEKIKL